MANSLVRNIITTILKQTTSNGTGSQTESGFEGNNQSAKHTGTAQCENTTTPQCAILGVTSEQLSHQTITDLVTEQSTSSSSPTSSDDEPPVSAGRVPTMESVSVRKKGRYEAHDKVDQYLLLQVSRHVQPDMIGLLAEYLGVSEEQYVDIRTTRTQPSNPRAQAWKVNTLCIHTLYIYSKRDIPIILEILSYLLH